MYGKYCDLSYDLLNENLYIYKYSSTLRQFIEVAQIYGNYLGINILLLNCIGESWFYLLQCISQLVHFSLFISQQKDGNYYISKLPNSIPVTDLHRNLIQQILNEFDVQSFDLIYLNSFKLSTDAIVDFVNALTRVSLHELSDIDDSNSNDSDPLELRRYSMQKVLEVADVNMNCRSKLEWTKIWTTMSVYFDTIACIQNETIALFSIDSLKQLSFKFLEKEELENFHFQKLFLKPFEIIIVKSHDISIKILVLQVVENIIYSCPDTLASGWSTLLNVLNLGTYDSDSKIIQYDYSIFSKVIKDYYFTTIISNFPCYTNCLYGFALCPILEYRQYAMNQFLLSKELIISGKLITKNDSTLECYTDDHIVMLRPYFTSLTSLIDCSIPDIQQKAMSLFFDILKDMDLHFSLSLWKLFYKTIIYPLFDDIKHFNDMNNNSNIKLIDSNSIALYIKLLQNTIDLFIIKATELLDLLNEIIELMDLVLKQPNQALARAGIDGAYLFLMKIGSQLTTSQWNYVITKFISLSSYLTPSELLNDNSIVHNNNNNNQQVAVVEKVIGDNIIRLSKDTVLDVYIYIYSYFSSSSSFSYYLD